MDITVYDVLAATETSLFEPTPSTVEDSALHIESVMHESVFLPLDQTVRTSLSHITIRQLADRANEKIDTGYMYYL
jgi:DNA-binding IscR family transcriptional regulator